MKRALGFAFIACIILALAAPAGAVEFKFYGLMRVRAYMSDNFDGRDEWTSQQIANATAGTYIPGHVYDRLSHFLIAGPGFEDNPVTGILGADVPMGPGLPGVTSGPAIRGAGKGVTAALQTGQEAVDDNNVYLDQRLVFGMNTIVNKDLRVITLFRTDAVWGVAGMGADWGADDVDISVLNCYVDFNVDIYKVPVNYKVGVQSLQMHRGWLLGIDAPAVQLTATFDPVIVGIAYIRANESGVGFFNPEDRSDDVDIYSITAGAGYSTFHAQATLMFQDGPSSTFTSNSSESVGATEELGNWIHFYALDLDYVHERFAVYFTGIMNGGENDYYHLNDWSPTGALNPTNILKPIGADYNGWMVDLGGEVFFGPFVASAEFMYITGDEFKDPRLGVNNNFFFYEDADDSIDRMMYPGFWRSGVGRRWSEIVGAGTLDLAFPGAGSFGQWDGGNEPYNIWALKLGGTYRVADPTSITFAYWYINTQEDVVSSVDEGAGTYGNVISMDSDIGHEINLYIDQVICEGLTLRLVGAYLFSGGAVSIWDDDENMYEYGVNLQMEF